MNCRTHAKWLVPCLIVVLPVGCESASTRQKTTGGGAAAGGLIGGIVGHQSGNKWTGTHLSLGNRAQARSDFARALSLNPSYVPARDNLRRMRSTEV